MAILSSQVKNWTSAKLFSALHFSLSKTVGKNWVGQQKTRSIPR